MLQLTRNGPFLLLLNKRCEENMRCFCKVATIEERKEHNNLLLLGRYEGVPDLERNNELFEEKLERLTETLAAQFGEGRRLESIIKENMWSMKDDD